MSRPKCFDLLRAVVGFWTTVFSPLRIRLDGMVTCCRCREVSGEEQGAFVCLCQERAWSPAAPGRVWHIVGSFGGCFTASKCSAKVLCCCDAVGCCCHGPCVRCAASVEWACIDTRCVCLVTNGITARTVGALQPYGSGHSLASTVALPAESCRPWRQVAQATVDRPLT